MCHKNVTNQWHVGACLTTTQWSWLLCCIQGCEKATDMCAHSSFEMCNNENTDTKLTSLSAFIFVNDIGSGPSSTSASNPSSTFTVIFWLPSWEDVRQVSLQMLHAISGTGVLLCKHRYIYQKCLCPLVTWTLIIHLWFTLEQCQYLWSANLWCANIVLLTTQYSHVCTEDHLIC